MIIYKTMKFSFLLAITLILTSCTTPTPAKKSPPLWYKNQTIKTKNSYNYIGYGEAKTLFQAKAEAKSDIAQQLLSSVESSYVEKMKDDNVTTEVNLKVTTKIDLENISIKKQFFQDGYYFVVLGYENLDLGYKIKKSVKNLRCSRADNYMKKTLLYKKLYNSFGCDIDVKLQRANKQWYLKYDEYKFLLSRIDFEKLYISTPSSLFDFMISNQSLQDGEKFYFNIKTDKKGYITLLNLYENGIVTVLKSSQKITKNLQIPSKESDIYFEAGLVDENRDGYDLYIAIYSEKPFDMSRFVYGDEVLAKDEIAYKFDELIEILNSYDYATLLVRTER